MATVTVKNGIDVEQLVGTIEAIKDNPAVAGMTFRAKTRWEEGTHSIAEIASFTHAGEENTSREQPFVLHGDEPPVLLGSNNGPNAVELCLAALGSCYSVGYVANAAAQGIQIDELSFEIEGDIDLHAFLGLGGGRPGFTQIRCVAHVKSPNATKEQLVDLCSYVQETSPVRDILANETPVTTTLEIA